VHERYRRQTDRQTDDTDRQTEGQTTTYSEHEHEFTFAKNGNSLELVLIKITFFKQRRYCRLIESGMELTKAKRQIDYVSDSGNKDCYCPED